MVQVTRVHIGVRAGAMRFAVIPPPGFAVLPRRFAPREKVTPHSPSRAAWGSTPPAFAQEGYGALKRGEGVDDTSDPSRRLRKQGRENSRPGPKPSCSGVEKNSVFGSEPNLGTQRFWPEFRNDLIPPHFSCWKSSKVRTRRGARVEPASPNRLDLQNLRPRVATAQRQQGS
jgi:hypothetical protein